MSKWKNKHNKVIDLLDPGLSFPFTSNTFIHISRSFGRTEKSYIDDTGNGSS